MPKQDKLALLRQESKFTDWQRVRVQETSKEIPAGSLPRSLDVILRHEIVEQARTGDTTSYRSAFIANSVQVCDGRRDTDIRNRRDADEDDIQQFSAEELDEIQQMRETPDFFNKLVDSIAPTVFRHQDIKRAIMLMLMGGVHKFTHEGINLRGDINVCIVGDPSCAKSQFLKYTAGLVPRSVYTSGKSSSAAGLTATVAKEPETGEFCIEEENNDSVDDGNDVSGHGATSQTPSGNKGSAAKKLVLSDEYFERVTRARYNAWSAGPGLAGLIQRELIQWYVGQQNEKNNYSSMEEAAAEVTKLKAIIESLIRREGYLIVVDDGRQDVEVGENAARPTASRNDRILAVAPNYVPE
ncbi:MCM DNA helicase complex subunit mcm6 [Orobanche gracilis]